MARIDDPRLQSLEGRVSSEIRAVLPRWELVTRLSYAWSLYDRAEGEPTEVAAVSRRTAGRVLVSLPLDDYLAELNRLNSELRAASDAEDFEKGGQVFSALMRIQAENPEIPRAVWNVAVMPTTGAELEDRHQMASRVLNLPKARGR